MTELTDAVTADTKCPVPLNLSPADVPDLGFVMSGDTRTGEWYVIGRVTPDDALSTTFSSFLGLRHIFVRVRWRAGTGQDLSEATTVEHP